jgi:foldase protein PrsA
MTRLIRSLETALQSPPPPVAKAADAPVAPPANELRQSAGEQQRVEPRMPEPRVAVEVVARERGWLKPFVASVVVLALSVVAVSVFSHASSQRAAVAFVNGQPIYRDDFLQKLKKGKTTGSALLNQSIQTVLIDQYARNHKIDVSQAQIDAKEAETRAKMQPGQFDEVVKQQGLTAHDVRHILEQQLILEKAVAPKIHVSDADIETYFDKNRAVFDKPEQVRARHILTDSRAKALQVLAGLRAGGNWTTLARQYSTDPSSKNKGGELGFFARAAMVTPFSDAAFNAEVGQLVGPVKTPFGYHIIQVEGRTRAAKATLAASRDQIRATLRQQHEATVVPAFLQQLRSAAKIEIVDPDLKDALASPAPAHS